MKSGAVSYIKKIYLLIIVVYNKNARFFVRNTHTMDSVIRARKILPVLLLSEMVEEQRKERKY